MFFCKFVSFWICQGNIIITSQNVSVAKEGKLVLSVQQIYLITNLVFHGLGFHFMKSWFSEFQGYNSSSLYSFLLISDGWNQQFLLLAQKYDCLQPFDPWKINHADLQYCIFLQEKRFSWKHMKFKSLNSMGLLTLDFRGLMLGCEERSRQWGTRSSKEDKHRKVKGMVGYKTNL